VRSAADAAALIHHGPEAVANRVYSGRNGTGLESTGDGWRYIGRGLLQITGRANNAAAAAACRHLYIGHPELLLQLGDATLASAWWWAAHGCNVAAVTLAINGEAMAGAVERLTLYCGVLAWLTLLFHPHPPRQRGGRLKSWFSVGCCRATLVVPTTLWRRHEIEKNKNLCSGFVGYGWRADVGGYGCQREYYGPAVQID
jgi:hypothetical protein